MKQPESVMHSALRGLLDAIERPPEPNCSCHIRPPCADCVEHGALRAAIEYAEHALKEDA